MQEFFTHNVVKYFPYRNNDNGCKDHHAELESSYREASQLIDAAVAAIATVKKNPRPNLLSRKDRWNWDRQAQTMFSMFGIKISSKGGPEPESQTDFKYVEGIFNEMKFGMDNDATTGSRNPGLYCNTDGWKFYENNAADPWRPAEKISDRKTLAGKQIFPRGAWGFNYNLVMFPDSTSETHGMCKDGVHAETVAPSSFITWCNYGFAVLALSLQPNAVKQWDYLSDPSRETMSLTWVHEFAHFYGSYSETNGLPDKPAVDENGNAIFGEGGVPVKTYGAPYVINLAKKSPRDATHTADAYAWFAVAMYLSDWNWSGGFAQGFSLF